MNGLSTEDKTGLLYKDNRDAAMTDFHVTDMTTNIDLNHLLLMISEYLIQLDQMKRAIGFHTAVIEAENKCKMCCSHNVQP